MMGGRPFLRPLISLMNMEPAAGAKAPVSSAFPIIRCSSWVSSLPYEVLSLLCQYLDARSLARLHGVCRPLRNAVSRASGEVWAAHVRRSFHQNALSPVTAYGDYVECQLRRAQIELASFQASRHVLDVVYQYISQRRGVIGLVGDLGYFENEDIARALSKKRSYALHTIVVQNEEVIADFKRRMPRFTGTPLTFFPLNAAFDIMTTPYHELTPVHYPGLLGYAVHLIKLRKEDEYLRHSLFFTIFKNLQVFETEADLQAYMRDTDTVPYACSLDYYQSGEDEVFPRFSHGGPRGYSLCDPAACQGALERHVRACVTSLAYIRYGT